MIVRKNSGRFNYLDEIKLKQDFKIQNIDN